MNMMIGCGDDFTSSITDFSRFSNSPFTPAPACSRPRSSVRRTTFFSAGRARRRRDAQREALHHGGLADAAFAVRIGLFLTTAGQDVDDAWRISGSRPSTGSILPRGRVASGRW